MKILSKIVPVLGGMTMLAAGCGSLDMFSSPSAEAIAADDKAVVITMNGSSGLTGDALFGVTNNCRGRVVSGSNLNVPFTVYFGTHTDQTTENAKIQVVQKDSGCTFSAQKIRINGVTYGFYDPTESLTAATPSAREIFIRDGYRADDAVLLRNESTKFPAGMLNVKGSGMNFSSGGFTITAITGSTRSTLGAAGATASKVSFSSVSSTASEEWASPNWTLAPFDAKIVADIDHTIGESSGTFRLTRAAGDPMGGDAIWGNPGTKLTAIWTTDGTAPNTVTANQEITVTNWAFLSPAHRYEILAKKYTALLAGRDPLGLGSSQMRSIYSSDLFPASTSYVLTNAEHKKNTLIIQRTDSVSGVKSYQAIRIDLSYTP